MASYGNIYQFSFCSQNGSDMDIIIAKKGYSGEVYQRPLGRAPILKRERNSNILGTSLEIYAECKIDGEYAQLYTSSADEFRVEVLRDGMAIWHGFVSPELYSEPDIAPPYDVQIIATDGLGELKNAKFGIHGRRNLMEHFRDILSRTNLSLGSHFRSSLKWQDESGMNNPNALLNLVVDLDHLKDSSCYEVLQGVLASFNACITQQGGAWEIIRETDLFDTLNAWQLAMFGSASHCEWWPVGQLSVDIVPAKKTVSLEHRNNYKDNVLTPLSSGVAGGWTLTPGVYYDEAEGGYILPPGAVVQNTINFDEYPLKTQVVLTIRARAIKPNTAAERVAYMINCEMQGRVQGQTGTYYLYPASLLVDASRQLMMWSPTQMYFFHGWDVPEGEPAEPIIEEFTVLIPISSDASADQLKFTIQNITNTGTPDHRLCIYDIRMVQDLQTVGLRYEAVIANNAREGITTPDITLESSPDATLYFTKWGVVEGVGGITAWETPYCQAGNLLSFLAQDYAMQVALSRMRYRGKLNVPSIAPDVPIVFERDSTYYFLNTYSCDLLNDELEVELISIPNAKVELESETVTELSPGTSPSGATSGGGGGTSGGGGGGSSEGGLTTDDLEDYLETHSYATQTWVTSQGYATQNWVINQDYAKNTDLTSLSKRVKYLEDNPVSLDGYATEQWVKDQQYATSISLDAAVAEIGSRLKAVEKLLEWFEFDEIEQMIKAKFGIYSVGAITAGKKEGE